MTRMGFTGTRHGMLDAQKEAMRPLLVKLRPAEAHHGDCVGADADFHELAKAAGAALVVHPPTDDSQRAFCQGDRVRPAKDHLARNRQIVVETAVLIAAPRGFKEELRSGTWATIGYGRKRGDPLTTTGLTGP